MNTEHNVKTGSTATTVPVEIPPRSTSINLAPIEFLRLPPVGQRCPVRQRKTDMKTPNHPQSGADDLLLFADLIQGYARRLENIATWRDVLQRNSDARAAGEHLGMAALLRHIQASRFAGIEPDVSFFIVCHMAERHAETIFRTDAALNELHAKIRAIKKREGLSELDEFDPDHPETPADWKVLDAKSNRRFQAVEKIRDTRFIRWLRRHGETDMADLYASDREAFDRRREAGGCKIYGPLPDINVTSERGTGLAE